MIQIAYYIATDKGYIPVYSQLQPNYNKDHFQTIITTDEVWSPASHLPQGGITYNFIDGSGSIVISPTTTLGQVNISLYQAGVSQPVYTWSFGYRPDRPLGYFILVTSDGDNLGATTHGYFSVGDAIALQPGFFPAGISYLNLSEPIDLNITFAQNFDFAEGAKVIGKPPYNDGTPSEPGGDGGDHDKSSDPVPVPALPSLSAVDTGFITLFNPSLTEIRSLATYMWSTNFDLDTFKKLFANPMDVIMGLSIVPVSIPSGGSRAVTVGNISTGVNMNVAAQQYIEKDCGSLTVPEFWGAYLDYAPYTKTEIYLPYIGTKTIDVDDVIGKTLNVVYHVDILSGGCVAFIKSDDHVLYSFTGQCAAQVPVTSADMNNLITGAISAAAAIGGALVTGGAAIPVVAAAASTARAVVSAKPNIDRSGDMSGYTGLLGIQNPYLIITRPMQCLPLLQNEIMGYPSFITRSLDAVSGYTEIESIHLAVPGASGPEMDEIETLLKEGVIL